MMDSDTDGDAEMADGRVVLRLERVTKSDGRKLILSDLSARFSTGELTAIVGARGCGKSLLLRVISGQRVPDSGHVVLSGPPAPQVAAGWALHTAGSLERGLGMIAAAYGIQTKSYVAAVASLLDDPTVLTKPFKEVPGVDRSLVMYACSYLVPAEVYLADGSLLPNAPHLRARLEPLFLDLRARATVILVTHDPLVARRNDANRFAILSRGKLRFFPDLDQLTDAFGAPSDPPMASEETP